MSFLDKIDDIIINDILSSEENRLMLLGRKDVSLLTKEERENILSYSANAAKIANDTDRELSEMDCRREKANYDKMITDNRKLLLSIPKEKRKLTKSLIDSLFIWSKSRYTPYKKSEIIDRIMNEDNDTAKLYSSGTFTEQSGCHGLKYSLYVDFSIKVIAKVDICGDAFDFEPQRLEQKNILEIYEFTR